MSEHPGPEEEKTFPMRVVSRMAGVTPERLRAWETRYGAVVPARTAGGARRYSHSDLERIQVLRRAVDAGHRISEIAPLETGALLARLDGACASGDDGDLFGAAIEAIRALDADALRDLFETRIERDGLVGFARGEAMAFIEAMGLSWASGELPVSCEHFASNVLRTRLLDGLGALADDGQGPRIVFATTSGEHHDLGLLVAAIVAADCGATVVFIGADVPEDDLVHVLSFGRVDALALGYVVLCPADVEASLKATRSRVAPTISIWAGGRGVQAVAPIRGVDRVTGFDQLRAFVLAARSSNDALGVAEGAS